MQAGMDQPPADATAPTPAPQEPGMLQRLRRLFGYDESPPIDLTQARSVTGPTTPGVRTNKGSRSLSAAMKATGKDAATVRAELAALGYTVTP